MKGKMDGAARRAERVAQRVLPDRPHHLCIDAKRRYPTPSGFWFTGQSARLQYMTYLSDADRGVLLTLPFFEIRDELDTIKPPMAAARGEAKKKMTFKDYQNKKKSTSPADNDPSAKVDSQPPDTAPAKQSGRKDNPKPNDRATHEDARPDKSRPETNYERSKNPSLPRPESTSARVSESRKRHSDTEQVSPPQKKTKTEATAPELDASRKPRADTPKSARDTANGKSAHKETKGTTLVPAVNGRSRARSDMDRASPASSIHVNGVAPAKAETAIKPALPELLSPLRLGFDEEMDSPTRTAGKQSEKEQKDSGRSQGDGRTRVPDLLSPLRLGLGEEQGDPEWKLAEKGEEARAREADDNSMSKKQKLLKRIPPLLSPTLPPIIEEELARWLKEFPPEDWSQEESQASQSPADVQKGKGLLCDENEEKRPSRIVVLRYRKKNARTVSAILALPSKSHKEALKKERSISLERTPPPHARKRPFPAEEQAFEPSSKRSKPTAEPWSAKSGVPSTPLKNSGTAMSRVTSNTSQAHTPGDPTGFTPSVADRPLTSSDNIDHASGAKAATLRQRQAEYTSLGGKLKHTKDDILRRRAGAAAALSTAEEKRVAALHFEMVLAYMVAFNALNQARALDRKVADITTWETLLPHLPELKHRLRRCRPLLALATQMHAVCLEQITHAFMTLDPTSVTLAHASWAKQEKRRVPTWAEAAALLEEVADDRMRASIGPWTAVDDAVASALAIMRRWADREGVSWRPEVTVPAARNP